MKEILAISIGASLGAVLRWGITLCFNELSQRLNLINWGTLLANLVGAFIAGLALMFFLDKTDLSPHLRLLVITGFCGALTTFSAFSLEIVTILQQGRISVAMMGILSHTLGAMLMTFLGIITWQFINKL